MKNYKLELHGNRHENKYLPTIEIPFRASDDKVAREFWELVHETFKIQDSYYDYFNWEMYLLNEKDEHV